MNVQETLEKLLRDSDETGDWGSPGRDDDAELLAPVFERALQVVADAVEDVYKDIYHEGSAMDEGIKAACVTAGIKAMVEGS